MDILKDLNESQREAVLTTEGPVLVIAGAGSGKTRALTHRIAYLMQTKKTRPHNILAVTFTNKAAGEMRDRVANLIGASGGIAAALKAPMSRWDTADIPTIGTFHSLCVRILRKHIHLLDFENQFVIFDDSDQLILMKHIMKDLKIDEKQLNPRSVLSHISNAKNKLIGPEKFQSMADSFFAQKVARLYGPYQAGLKKNNALDFDDLLVKTIELFRTHKPVLEQYQNKFLYIHVDEYQDTNHTQYVLTNMLAERHKNLFVIGDGDQSIYSWRGADITNILEFEKDYPKAKVIKMEQNYRSTNAILESAQAVIIKNKRRKEKTLWTERDGGDPVQIWIAQNERHEGELAAEEIREKLKGYEYPDYRDFTVLYRINAQSRALEETFMRYGIPYKIVGGIRFYERKEIKDLTAYLRVIANPADTVSLLRIVNSPPRQIGPKTLEVLQTFANTRQCTLFEAMRRAEELGEQLPELKREKVARFAKIISKLQKKNQEVRPAALIKYILDETGYKKHLDDGSVEGEARLENAAEFISVAAKYEKLEPGMALNIFLEEISLIADIDTLDEKDNAVTLMTLHAAKGLEFPYVFICGLEEGLLPHSRSMLDPAELEEERRLFYVGCTRAMDKLYLLYTKNRMFYGQTQDAIPSQFLSDIPEEFSERNVSEDGADYFGLRWGARTHRDTARTGPGIARRGGPDQRRFPRKLTPDEIKNAKPVPAERPLREFSDGDRVMHELFGEGMIVSVQGGIVTVAFKNPKYGIKKLAIAIAPLEKMG